MHLRDLNVTDVRPKGKSIAVANRQIKAMDRRAKRTLMTVATSAQTAALADLEKMKQADDFKGKTSVLMGDNPGTERVELRKMKEKAFKQRALMLKLKDKKEHLLKKK